MKKIISLLLAGLLCANLTAPALAAEDTADTAAPGQTAITFTDMPSSPEFVESITWAVETASPPACTTASSGRTTPAISRRSSRSSGA
ncbi:MAG: hypothetical protein ACLR4Z_16060 [Butyricicoccaceae bacterium]